MAEYRRSLRDRFEEKVAPADETGCWNWTACKSNGYGIISRGPGLGNANAHRVAYELFKGEIPDGLVIDHICRNPACVNPDHLEAVTHGENTRRSPIMGRKRQTHCQRGHEFTTENTMVSKANGSRKCKICWYSYRRSERTGKRERQHSEFHSRRDLELIEILAAIYPNEMIVAAQRHL
jgi:hypothetical protein